MYVEYKSVKQRCGTSSEMMGGDHHNAALPDSDLLNYPGKSIALFRLLHIRMAATKIEVAAN
jgi:hypothetical protein